MEDVAGYRVLRSAGVGERTRLLVGFDDGVTVVLKVAGVDDPATDVEIEALTRAGGDHVVELFDAASDERESVLVLERLPRGTLAELLERRGTLDDGEAVTILAPLALTLDRIHGAGVAHGGVSPTAICFRDDGAPVLTGFGRAELFAPGSPDVVRETVHGVDADRRALREVVSLVLARVTGERGAAARRLVERVHDQTPAQIAAQLFGLATPAPVRFDADPVEPPIVRTGDVHDEPVDDDEPAVVLPGWLTTWIPEGLRERVTEAATRVHGVWSGWQPTRRRLVLGVAAGGLTVLVAVALVPTGSSGSTAAPPVSPEATEPQASPAEPSLPDDPVEAALVLLETREECVRDLSTLCLDAVVQAGSAAYDDDVALIRAVQEGGEYPTEGIAPGDPVLVERLGDSVLLDLPAGSEPASILLLRTTNGWRIRGYLESPDPDAPAVSDDPG